MACLSLFERGGFCLFLPSFLITVALCLFCHRCKYSSSNVFTHHCIWICTHPFIYNILHVCTSLSHRRCQLMPALSFVHILLLTGETHANNNHNSSLLKKRFLKSHIKHTSHFALLLSCVSLSSRAVARDTSIIQTRRFFFHVIYVCHALWPNQVAVLEKMQTTSLWTTHSVPVVSNENP